MNLVANIIHKCFQLKERGIYDLSAFICSVETQIERITDQEVLFMSS